MELAGARLLVAGATGELGGALARALADADARLALAGRDRARLGALGDELGAPTLAFDVEDAGAARALAGRAAETLDGLDGVVVSVGAAGFGPATDDDVRRLFAVNALGPIAIVDGALEHLGRPAAVVGVSAIVAEHPTAGLAHYSAAKAALSAYLVALRRERRRDGVAVIDVRPPHLDTGFAERPLFGTPPALPAPLPVGEVVEAVLDALREDRREVAWDLKARALVSA